MSRGLRFNVTANDRSQRSFGTVQNNIKKTQALQGSWNKGLNQNRRAVQQFGFQMTDFAVQIAGGQDAMLAFTQQGGQMLQFFGPFGAIMAALLAVFGSLFIAFDKSGAALSSITPILGVLQDDFSALIEKMQIFGNFMIDMANVVVNNLDRIIITAAVVVGFFTVKWVAGFLVARIATMSLAGAMVFLKGALLRTGIGIFLVGLGEVAFQFTRLVRKTGDFGSAIAVLSEVAGDFFDFWRFKVNAWVAEGKAASAAVDAAFTIAIGNIVLVFQKAMNFMLKGWNALMDLLPEGVKNAVGLSKSSFVAFGDNIVAIGNRAKDMVPIWKNVADKWNTASRHTGAGLIKLQGLLKDTNDQGKRIDVRDWFSGGGSDGKGGKSGVADKLSEDAKRIKKIFEDVSKSISGSIASNFNALRKGTKSAGDAMMSILENILDKMIEVATQPIFDAIGAGIAGAITFGLGGIGNPSGTGTLGLPSFMGGGSTGQGSRTGGVDGRGGFHAILHPNESVIDHSKGGGSGGDQNVVVNIYENSADETRVDQSPGRIDVYLRKTMTEVVNNGGMDKALKSRFGLKQQPMGA